MGIEPGDAGHDAREPRTGHGSGARGPPGLAPAGYRFRVDHPLVIDRRRRDEILFTRTRLVVIIDGCFGHGGPEHYRYPTSNAAFWAEKIDQNVRRDRDMDY